MTESLHMAIVELLEELELEHDRSDSAAFATLRARLMADFSDALAKEGDLDSDGERLLNAFAAHLEGCATEAQRQHLIAVLAHRPETLAALESAAAFLSDLKPHEASVSDALFRDAMAAFAPQQAFVPAAVAAAVPLPIAARRRVNWQVWGAMAATILVGVIGGTRLWQINRTTSDATPPNVAVHEQAPSTAPAPPPNKAIAPLQTAPAVGSAPAPEAAAQGASSDCASPTPPTGDAASSDHTPQKRSPAQSQMPCAPHAPAAAAALPHARQPPVPVAPEPPPNGSPY